MKHFENEYLTESKLGEFLRNNSNTEWIHDKCFQGRFRPDYRSDDLKLIIEFDGDAHYTKASTIIRDARKDKEMKKYNFRVIRIPYFIQLCDNLELCNSVLKTKTHQVYPHGFISDSCVLPADFCELGIEKFENDLNNRFEWARNEILESIENKIKKLKDWRLVLPPSLYSKYFN